LNLSNLVDNAIKAIKQNSPEILAGLSIGGVLSTAYLAARGGMKAGELLYIEQTDRNWKEDAKRVWRFYIPAGISGVATIGCIIGSHKVNGNRLAAAVAAYSISEKAFQEYKEKVVEELGKGKEEKIRDEIAQEKVNIHPNSREVIVGSFGHVLCCELFTMRYFRSDMETLRKAQNDINARIIHSLYVTMDEFYDMIGLSGTSLSSQLGWDSDKMMELEFSTVLADNNEPCLAFDYNYNKTLFT
jgi:Family of unknown function (DUF6353)